jgi:hypothetical protein
LKINIRNNIPLKKPNKKPNPLSIDPTPVQVTALLKVFPISIVIKSVKIKIAILIQHY